MPEGIIRIPLFVLSFVPLKSGTKMSPIGRIDTIFLSNRSCEQIQRGERRIHFEQVLSKREIFSSFPRIIYCKMSRKIKILHLIRDGSFGIDSFNGMRPFCCFPFFRPKKTFFSFSRRTHSSAVKSSRNEKFSTQNVKKYREKFEISDS